MKHKVSVVLLLIVALVAASMVIATPVKASSTFYVSTTGNDTTGDGSQLNPWLTIQHAVNDATVISGDTVMVAAGTYVEIGQIVIAKDLSIIGDSASTTIIKPSADTGSSGDAKGWFLVGSGVTFNLRDVTLDGSGHKVWQAIRTTGKGVVTECIFTNIEYDPSTSYAGNAIAAFGIGNVDVSSCTFTQIGRIGVFYYGNGITGSTCSNNKFIGKGAGDWLDYAIELGAGAHATITKNIISENLGVASVDGSTSAGILATTYFGAGSQALITCNDIYDCTDGIAVGYDGSDTSSVTVHYNNIHDNAEGIGSTAPAVDATYNWWGSETGPTDAGNPGGTGDPVTGNVNYASYLTSPVPSALYVSPTSVSKAPSDVGETFTVAIMLSQFSYLMGFEINLTWDDSLITFVSADKTPLSILFGPGGWDVSQSGAGYYNLSAASTSNPASNTGASVLFNVAFQVAAKLTSPLSTPIHFALVKLANNETPSNSIPAIVTDGTYTMSATLPGLEFKVEKWAPGWEFDTSGPPYHFERDGYFHVDVYVTNVGGLNGYNLTIDFTSTTVAFMGLERVYSVSPPLWGIFGEGNVSYTPGTPSAIQVNGSAPAGSAWSGSEGLLFALRFHVEFDAAQAHIWKYGNPNNEIFQYSIAEATLYFGSLGIIPKSGITTPSPLEIEVDFIRGDVDCNRAVNMADISAVAWYYHRISTDPSWTSTISKYDLNDDGIIDIYDIVTTATNYGYGT